MKQAKLTILIVIALIVAAAFLWRMGVFTPAPSASGKRVAKFDDPELEREFQEWLAGGDANAPQAPASDANKPAEPNEPNKPVPVVEPNKPAAPGEPNQPAEPNQPPGPNEPNEPMEALSLKDVDLDNLLQKIAEWEDTSVSADAEARKVKFTIITPKKIPRRQALALIYSHLRRNGFMVERNENGIYIGPISQARLRSVPTVSDDQPLVGIEDKNAVVRKFFLLKNYSPTQMSEIVLPLVGEYGYVGADEATGNLFVIDTVDNLIGIEKVIRQFDVPESEQEASDIFYIKNSDPAEIVQLLRILLGEDTRGRRTATEARTRGGSSPRPGASAAGEAKSVVIPFGRIPTTLIADTTRRCIIVRGSAEAVKEIGQWIEKLDTGERIESDYETVQVVYADPREVATEIERTLQRMPGQELTPSVAVRPLPQARQILIVGRADMRDMVKKLIADVDIPKGDFETRTFKLEHADPDQIKANLEGIYDTQAGYMSSYGSGYRSYTSRTVAPTDVVKVMSLPTRGEVTVIASPENMLKIEAQIKEWDVPIDVEKVKPRIITLHNSDPVQMAELLSTLFSEESDSMDFFSRYYGLDEGREKIVGPLYGQLTFEAVPDTKKIIVISNLAQAYDVIENLIRELDSQEMAEVPNVVTLKYADVEDLAERLNAIFNEPGTSAPIRYRETGLTSYTTMQDSDVVSSGGGNQGQSGNQTTTLQPYQPPWGRSRPSTDQMPISNVIGRVRFIPDPRTKSILVLAPPEFQPHLEEMIRELDVPGKQVMIKAIIVEVDHRDLTSLGVQLSSDPYAFDPIGENAVTALTQLSTLYERGSFTLAAGMEVTVLVDFLQRRLDAKILNEQSVWTEDNEQAFFFKGDLVGFIEDVSVSGTGERVTSDVSFKQVGVALQARPSITPESRVDMLIRIEISQLKNEFVNNQPVRAYMTTETNMIVENGQTIMLGGILFQNQSTIERKIPLLSDIPLLGGIFNHHDIAETNNEMIVFITPYVVDSPENTLPETQQMLDEAKWKLSEIRGQLRDAVADPNCEPMRDTIYVPCD